MKLIKKAAVFLMSLGVLASQCLAVRAADEAYTYTVRFFSGAQGTILGDEMVSYDGLHSGDRVTFNQRSVQLNDNSKYYVRGIRESGRDNNTTKSTTSFLVNGDMDYVVVYGVLSNAVGYTVRYQDNDGNQLAPDENYYGNVGDEPVLAYLYIEGYLPQAYNLTAVLKENAAENIFTFVYTPITEEEPTEPPTTTTPATGTTTPTPTGAVTTPATPAAGAADAGAAPGAADAGAADAGAAPGGADAGTAAPAEGTPDDLVDLDNPDVPLDNTNLDNNEVPLSNLNVGDYGMATMLLNLPLAAKTGIFSAAILLAGGGVWLYKSGKLKLRRKPKSK